LAFFADAFMARHLLHAMPGSGTRFTLSLPAILPEATFVKKIIIHQGCHVFLNFYQNFHIMQF
jgi:hypothetical protein